MKVIEEFWGFFFIQKYQWLDILREISLDWYECGQRRTGLDKWDIPPCLFFHNLYVQNSTQFIFPEVVWSKVSLYHTNDARYFSNTEKTQHRFSTANKKWVSNTQCYGILSFPRSGEPIVKSSRHTTAIYSINKEGEVLPPLYIFDSRVKNGDHFKVYLHWCNVLPTFTVKYGLFRSTRLY